LFFRAREQEPVEPWPGQQASCSSSSGIKAAVDRIFVPAARPRSWVGEQRLPSFELLELAGDVHGSHAAS